MSADGSAAAAPTEAPTTGRVERVILLLWVALAAAGMWRWRDAPEPAAISMDEEQERERIAQFVVRDAQTWQRDEGDRTIAWDEANGHLAIVIDDVGRELEFHEKLQALRYPLTFSVLPRSVYAMGAQLRLSDDPRRYRELWLHLPMEPMDGQQMQLGPELDEVFLLHDDSPGAIARKVDEALALVPNAVGVNNHMGSRLTTDRAAMDAVMEALAERDLLFLDSRTTAETVAVEAAEEHGVPVASRRVFLDHDTDPEAVRASVIEAIDLARESPTIAIGHPNAATLEALDALLPQAEAAGVGVYPLSHLVARGTARPTR